jgi:hypothetical protein
LSIGYAFRPRLRSRLTLGGRTFPRKPWAFGGRDSHPPFRILMPRILTSARSTDRYRSASLHAERSSTTYTRERVHIHSFGGVLEPRYIVGAESLDQ